MKGTLLLLTLLVIGELGFQTTEACFPFFGLYLGTVSGSKLWLHHELSYFNPTPGETEAYEKIQNCFNEAGSLGKLRDIKVMATLLFSSKCKTYYSKEVLTKIKAQFTQALKALGYDGLLDNSSS